ncbi:MAG: inorganic phosphate transporter [Pseudohongiellaceae bacterium]
MIEILIVAVLFLSYCNGANDNFKGVATLYGSGTVNYLTAISLATIATFAGSLASLYLAQGLVSAFSGNGLVPDLIAADVHFLIAVAAGASLTVLLATRLGLPVSTTHGLIGGLLGAGLIASGADVNFSQLGSVFVLPLLLSPILSCALAFGLYRIASSLRHRAGLRKELCLCVGNERFVQAVPNLSGFSALAQPQSLTAINSLTLRAGDMTSCREFYTGKFAGVSLQWFLDAAHVSSAAMVSFARGLNDTPKIAGLLVVATALDVNYSLSAIAVIMGIGGLLNARRVAETISHRITDQSHGQGFVANLVTGILVISASRLGLRVSCCVRVDRHLAQARSRA